MLSHTIKPVILVFVSYYLPGYKAGGILRTLVNTVDQLHPDFDFKIVTQDHDQGDTEPYPGIVPNQWNQLGNAQVYHMSAQKNRMAVVKQIIAETKHDLLYLNSFFDPVFSIPIMLLAGMGKLPEETILLAPRGEMNPAALQQKKQKKRIFLSLARLSGFYKKVGWHASTPEEAKNIAAIMHVRPGRVHTALDLPRLEEVLPDIAPDDKAAPGQKLRLVFLARISREKNLDYALKVLKDCKTPLQYDIYGPIKDSNYWEECKKIIQSLPAHVSVDYKSEVRPEQVTAIFNRYDLFFFPTTGESYGHSIAESLTAGTPVLISDNTPWKNLEQRNMGWEVSLSQPHRFAEIIDDYGRLQSGEKIIRRSMIRMHLKEELYDPGVVQENKLLFHRSMKRS